MPVDRCATVASDAMTTHIAHCKHSWTLLSIVSPHNGGRRMPGNAADVICITSAAIINEPRSRNYNCGWVTWHSTPGAGCGNAEGIGAFGARPHSAGHLLRGRRCRWPPVVGRVWRSGGHRQLPRLRQRPCPRLWMGTGPADALPRLFIITFENNILYRLFEIYLSAFHTHACSSSRSVLFHYKCFPLQ